MRELLAAAVLLSAGLAGCLGDGTPGEEATRAADTASAASDEAAPPTVIAVPDTGINPYHEVFQGGPTFADVPGFPEDARTVELTRNASSYDQALAADEAVWDDVERDQLVHFPGTRLAAISFGAEVNGSMPSLGPIDDDVHDPPAPILDVDGHGTLVSHAALAASPHSVIVMVQTPDDEGLTEVMPWIAEQGWIDLVTVSWGTWTFEYAQGEARMDLPPAYREAYEAGKLVFNGAGNEPVPHHVTEQPGPPFVVAVGGSEEDTRGESEIAAKLPDVVAPFTQSDRAEAQTLDGYTTASGTSLSSPLAAGSVAEALWLARDRTDADLARESPALARADAGGAFEDGELTKEELWAATNASAVQWGADDWKPRAGVSGAGYGLPVAHPGVQMGWGQVTPAVSEPIADLLVGDGQPTEKAPGTAAIMRASDDAARELWGSPAGEDPADIGR